MIDKRSARQRRARKSRAHMKVLGMPRLSVHRSDQHLYAQVIDANGGTVLAAASTLQKSVNEGLKGMKNKTAAAAVGKLIAERAIAAGVQRVAFDRSGFKYHGRIQALADAAREGGLQF